MVKRLFYTLGERIICKFALVALLGLFGAGLLYQIPHNAFCQEETNHAGELGYCALCNTRIMDRVDNYLKKNSEYKEAVFLFSNGQKGRVAFCREHFKNLSEADYLKIMEGIRNGWAKDFEVKEWKAERIQKYKDNFFNITIQKRLKDEEIYTAD